MGGEGVGDLVGSEDTDLCPSGRRGHKLVWSLDTTAQHELPSRMFLQVRQVRVVIDAPREMNVVRSELMEDNPRQ